MSGRLRRLLRPLDAVAEVPGGAVDPAVAERLDRLEQMVEGLQDTTHRQAKRVESELADVRRRLDPAELAKALSEDARRRGL